MSDTVAGGHPPQDVLADLAAEALPLERAGEVEAHVMACPSCERLLADAERVRALLSAPAPDAGPMPPEVWSRIEAGLLAEAADRLPAPPAPPPDLSFDEAPTAAWKAFLDDPPTPPPLTPVPQRMGRAVRAMRTRRDVRTEHWASHRRQRPGVVLAAIAAGIAALGLAGLGVLALTGGDRTGAATDVLPGAGARNALHSTGTEYTAATLARQVKALVGAAGSTSATARGSARPVPIKAGTVADPRQLQACLSALGEHDRQPVTVDLARYQGREAAVIVLPARGGGYDVWVVARACRPGAEGTQAYKAGIR